MSFYSSEPIDRHALHSPETIAFELAAIDEALRDLPPESDTPTPANDPAPVAEIGTQAAPPPPANDVEPSDWRQRIFEQIERARAADRQSELNAQATAKALDEAVARVSKIASKRRRETVVSSRRSSSAVTASRKTSATARPTTSVGNPSTALTSPSHLIKTSNEKRMGAEPKATTRERSELGLTLYPWERSAYPIKVARYFEALATRGDTLAFTLNLDPLLETDARAHPELFKKRMRQRIDRALKKLFPDHRLEFLFVVGTTGKAKGDRLHLHGVILATSNMIPGVKQALAEAGGKWRCARGKQHQADARVQYDAAGWAAYVERHVASGFRALSGINPISTPKHLPAIAKALHEAERKRLLKVKCEAALLEAWGDARRLATEGATRKSHSPKAPTALGAGRSTRLSGARTGPPPARAPTLPASPSTPPATAPESPGAKKIAPKTGTPRRRRYMPATARALRINFLGEFAMPNTKPRRPSALVQEFMIRAALDFTPEWGRDFVRPAFAGDPDEVLSLMCALHDYQRADMVQHLYRFRVPPGAFRAALDLALTQSHHYNDVFKVAGSWRQFMRWCRYAAFPLPDDLPDMVTVYRGAHGITPEQAALGAFWTLDFGVAAWFACRHRDTHPERAPIVIQAEVPRSSIVFYSNDRNENEVIFDARVQGVVWDDSMQIEEEAIMQDMLWHLDKLAA